MLFRSEVPPMLQIGSVVYILRFGERFYVGETENFKRRIKAHELRFRKSPDQVWVIKQFDKSKARATESSLIQAYLREGIPLLSTTDGFHSLSIAAN